MLLKCWCTDAADALMLLMLLNQDQGFLADLPVAICSSLIFFTLFWSKQAALWLNGGHPALHFTFSYVPFTKIYLYILHLYQHKHIQFNASVCDIHFKNGNILYFLHFMIKWCASVVQRLAKPQIFPQIALPVPNKQFQPIKIWIKS